jgi:hypothetical protein
MPDVGAAGTRGVEPVSIVAETSKELGFTQPRVVRIAVERLAEAYTIERAGGHDLEYLRAL